jgi:hypothetical protein
MSNINEVVVRYVAAWNERDSRRRRDLIASTWREDGIYRDAHGMAKAMKPSTR